MGLKGVPGLTIAADPPKTANPIHKANGAGRTAARGGARGGRRGGRGRTGGGSAGHDGGNGGNMRSGANGPRDDGEHGGIRGTGECGSNGYWYSRDSPQMNANLPVRTSHPPVDTGEQCQLQWQPDQRLWPQHSLPIPQDCSNPKGEQSNLSNGGSMSPPSYKQPLGLSMYGPAPGSF